MISMIRPLPVGNALRIFIAPPDGARYWRVLRKATATFAGVDDESALVAYEGSAKSFVDAEMLPNEQMAFYRPFYRVGDVWVEGETASASPAAVLTDHTTDVVAFLRARIEAGMLVEVEREAITSPELGYVQVFTAPPSLEQNIFFPLVTLELDNASPCDRGIGEMIDDDAFDGDDWIESEGWLERVSVSIVTWSLNSDERIEMRKALRRILLGNLPVLDDAGIQQVEFSFRDMNHLNGEFGAPVYQAVCDFTCIAPAKVSSTASAIEDVEVTVRG